MYDIIVVGGGPAGLTAALYARRANKNVLIIEKATFGGQITYSPKVENIPGFISLTGNEFAEKLVEQVLNQDAEVECAEVLEIRDGDIKTVVTDSGEFEGKSIIIATGAKHRLLGLENEQNLIGEGISFCAVCDGAFYEGKTVAVIGGGNSALQEAILLSDLAKKVYVIQNLDFLTGEQRLQEIIAKRGNVPVIALSQLNRDSLKNAGKRPSLADLRDTGAIEQDADGVILIHRPGYFDPEDDQDSVELIVAKNRHGATGTVTLHWNAESGRITETEREVDQ
jgi:thioredoxin reductase